MTKEKKIERIVYDKQIWINEDYYNKVIVEERESNLITFKEWCSVEGIEPSQERWNILLEMLGFKQKKRILKMKVVHYKKEKFDVYIGRPSKWGNPFSIGKDGTREEVIEKYKEWIMKQPKLLDSLDELKGKVLGCWCSPKKCHGDILLGLIKNEKNSL